jgi:hypothetical protein
MASLRLSILAAIILSIVGCYYPQYKLTTMTKYSDDPNYPLNDDARKEKTLDRLDYYSQISTPLKLQCKYNGSWQDVVQPNSSVEKSANGQPVNYNVNYPNMPVYRHSWNANLITLSPACDPLVKGNNGTFSTGYYQYQIFGVKHGAMRIVDSDNNLQRLFRGSEEQCFNSHNSDNLWERTLACDTYVDQSFPFVEYGREIVRVGEIKHSMNVLYKRGDWQCSVKAYMDGNLVGQFGDFTSSTQLKIENLSAGAHTLGIETINCIRWYNPYTTYGYTFRVDLNVQGSAVRARPGAFYPNVTTTGTQNFSFTISP